MMKEIDVNENLLCDDKVTLNRRGMVGLKVKSICNSKPELVRLYVNRNRVQTVVQLMQQES
jgi:hypothetical protein